MTNSQAQQPLVSICIPHYQVPELMQVCLRSIRKHTTDVPIEVIVVDNGSADASLDYLRTLSWIRLIETDNTTWPYNVFKAWDIGAREARGEFFMTMHSDVFIKRDGWLAPYLEKMRAGDNVVAVGGWKLEDPSLTRAFYEWQKHVVGTSFSALKSVFGRKRLIRWRRLRFPRDYAALYRKQALLEHDLTFLPQIEGAAILQGEGGGYAITQRLWNAGYTHSMLPMRTMANNMVHIAHGTSAFVKARQRSRESAQLDVERAAAGLFGEPWVQALLQADELDR